MQSRQVVSLLTNGSKSKVFFRHARWQGKRYCIHCRSRKVYRLKTGQLKCARCSAKFRELTGTYLEKLHIPCNEIAHLLYLFVLGVPAYRCRRYLRVSLKTAQKAYTLFRTAIYDYLMDELEVRILAGEIEMDETMYGGHRKGKRGWGAAGKHLVFGMYQRNGQVITVPVTNRKIDTLYPLIKYHTKAGSLYYSDDWFAYTWLSVRGNHVVVRKEKGAPKAKGRDHMNGIEGFWSYSKNWLYQYRGIPRHHFPLYLKETEFRFNNRNQDLFILITDLITKLVPNRS